MANTAWNFKSGPAAAADLQPDNEIKPSVGDHLRVTRQKFDLNLADVAAYLKIRRVYLEAIENNQIDQLPGPTYAIGFVRSYADYLGLDGEAMVERYKDESADLEARTHLVFPTPVSEGKVPSGAIISIAVICIALAYGGWLFLTTQDRSLAEVIPDLPDRFLAMLQNSESAVGPATPSSLAEPVKELTAPAIQAAPVAKVETTSKSDGQLPASVKEADVPTAEPKGIEIPAAKTGVASEQAVVMPLAAPLPAEAKVSLPENHAAQAPLAETETAATGLIAERNTESVARIAEVERINSDSVTPLESKPAEPKPAESIPAAEQAASDQQNAPVANETNESGAASEPSGRRLPGQTAESEAMVEKPSAETEPPAPVQAALPPPPPQEVTKGPRLYGAENENSRILIKAKVDSWVEVRDSDGELLLTRVLRAGDAYRVPDKSGLMMLTGNAGGLGIEVDGKLIPEIGPLGAVRRNIALDVEQLKSGTSTQ